MMLWLLLLGCPGETSWNCADRCDPYAPAIRAGRCYCDLWLIAPDVEQ